ncbi:MAG: hypothetical protein M0T80_07210 [Actinomycetota bacterium]|nr:hypothetical protein [Actinomycetota bacterium]
MARRIDIELTSSQPDGTWTWRAAGALQPRGVLDGSLLHAGAKPGDVVKVDAEFEIDGITVVSVLAPRAKHRREPERIELLAPARELPGVTTQLAGRGDRRGPGRGEHRGPRSEPGPRSASSGDRPPGSRERRDLRRPESGARGRGEPVPRSSERGDRRSEPAGGAAPGVDGAGEERRRSSRAGRSPREGTESRGAPGRPARTARLGRRLNPGDAHRRALLESLPPEQLPVAEQVLRGGIPAVRTAVHLERDKALAEGRPAPQPEALIALAESMLPRLKAAEWLDRAEAARSAGDEIGLRDLRSVVTGADLARDDESRALAASLREALESRLARLHADWTAEIRKHLDEHRVVRALRLAGRPPEPTTRLDAELATRLAEAASASLVPETSPERWVAVLEAAAGSPVCRNVRPGGIPPEMPEAALAAVRQQVGRVPALAALLGIRMPPPPGPVRAPGSPGAPARQKARQRRPDPLATQSPTAPAPEQPAAPLRSTPEEEPATEQPATSEQPASPEQEAPEHPSGSGGDEELSRATRGALSSGEGGEDPPVVEQLGQPVDQG